MYSLAKKLMVIDVIKALVSCTLHAQLTQDVFVRHLPAKYALSFSENFSFLAFATPGRLL